jgi:hypothetical protein
MLVFSLIPMLKTRKEEQKYAWLWLLVISWIWIAVSSLRAGGDQWDNPRYRAILLLFQAVLAAKAWGDYRRTRHPWFPRVVAIELIFTVLFSYWYASRYFSALPPFSFSLLVPLIVLLSAIVILGGWWLDVRRSKQG